MIPDAPILNLILAAASIFLVGINCALLYRFWPEPWLSLKVCAVSTLLLYIVLSSTYGQPAQWRVGVGLAAIVVDGLAMWNIWKQLEHAKRGEEGILIAYRRR